MSVSCEAANEKSCKTPTSWADLSVEGDAELWLPTKSATGALEMRNGVNEKRCKKRAFNYKI